ncbi:MAG: AAA family ATPase [Candidatus Heimdallarchaeaceae archaeon]
MNHITTVIGITGMPGSGKSVFAKFGREYGFEIVIMGDVIRKKVREEGLEPTPENCNTMMQELRKIHGKAAVAFETIAEINRIAKEGKNMFIIDGIRSQAEVDVFRKEFGDSFDIVAIHTDPKIRFSRLQERKRSDAPKTIEEFNERDAVELNVGLGEAIAFANYVIENNNDLDNFRKKAIDFFNYIERKGK